MKTNYLSGMEIDREKTAEKLAAYKFTTTEKNWEGTFEVTQEIGKSRIRYTEDASLPAAIDKLIPAFADAGIEL